MKYTLFFAVLFNLNSNAQVLHSERAKIDAASKNLESVIAAFQGCIIVNDINLCIENLKKAATDQYENYAIAGLLYDIAPSVSLDMHREAYNSNKNILNFNLEYALELHRNKQYADAIPIYLKVLEATPKDYRINVWLADCYINTNEPDKAIESWNRLAFPQNHTGIDFAIHIIYGKTNQLQLRCDYRNEIAKGKYENFYKLIFLDMNWEYDWWNSGIQENLLEEDIKLLKSFKGMPETEKEILMAYIDIKRLSHSENSGEEIKKILSDNGLIVNGGILPKNGQIASDLLRIGFVNGIIDESDFYNSRGNEALSLAKKTKDKDMLNIYAYLQATVEGKVTPEIDKLGWTDFNDERFAVSYFIGKADNNNYDDPELIKALADFPYSANLQWVKLNCAYIEKKPLKQTLIDLIKKEFKALGSDTNHYSYSLNSYFVHLSEGE